MALSAAATLLLGALVASLVQTRTQTQAPAAPVLAAAAVQATAASAAAAPASASATLRISLLAGDGHAGLQDGPALQARFADPYGLARHPDGRLYIADASDNNRIRLLASNGSVSSIAGGAEGFRDGIGGEARFNTPSGLALDAAGNLYVADTGNHAIRKIGPDGRVSTLAGTGHAGFRDGPGAQAQFNGPIGVAVDGAGRVLVADTYNDRIRVISPDGLVSTLAGGDRPGLLDGAGAEARFDTPCGLAVDAQGVVWVADTRNDALRRIAPDGRVSTLLRADERDDEALLRRPLSLTVAPGGALLVGVQRHGALLRVSPQAELQVLHDQPQQRLARPSAIVLAADGTLLVADAAAGRVHAIRALASGDSHFGAAHSAPKVELVGSIGPAPERALPATAGRWPVKPQLARHEVVGTMGEVRGDGRKDGDSRDHLHDGLDIRGDVGQEVRAIADAKVSSPLASGGFGQLGEGLSLDRLTYVHMRVGRNTAGAVTDAKRFQLLRNEQGKPERMRVRRGTRFAAGDVLGSINAMAHVHLSLGTGGYQINPLLLGFKDFVDKQPPQISSIEFLDIAGKPIAGKVNGRLLLPRAELQLVVDAWDQVDGNQARRRLGLYSLGWQLLQADGRPLPLPGQEQPQVPLSFMRLPAMPQAAKLLYAPDSGITVHGSAETHFRYLLPGLGAEGQPTPGRWSTGNLPAGDYLLRIVARDFAGNQALQGRDLALTLR